MLRSTACKSIALMCLCTLILAIPLVMASDATDSFSIENGTPGGSTESFSIYTDKAEYLVGEAVNIYVKADAIDPGQTITVSDVIIYDPANVSVAEWHNVSIVLTDTETPAYVGTIMAESEGSYTVSAAATGCPWILRAIWRFLCRCWRHHVVPEVPFGTVIAAMSFLGATGFYAVRKRYPKKIEKT